MSYSGLDCQNSSVEGQIFLQRGVVEALLIQKHVLLLHLVGTKPRNFLSKQHLLPFTSCLISPQLPSQEELEKASPKQGKGETLRLLLAGTKKLPTFAIHLNVTGQKWPRRITYKGKSFVQQLERRTGDTWYGFKQAAAILLDIWVYTVDNSVQCR